MLVWIFQGRSLGQATGAFEMPPAGEQDKIAAVGAGP